MQIPSQPGRCIRSRRIARLHSLADLTVLATCRLSVAPRQGIPGHSAFAGPGGSPTGPEQEGAMKTRRHAVTSLRGMTIAVALSLASAATLWAGPPTAAPPPPAMATVPAAYGHLPLSFEANHGQMDSRVQFLTRGRGHQLFLTPGEAVLAWRTGEAKPEGRKGLATPRQPASSPPAASQSVVRMRFEGTNPQADVVGLDGGGWREDHRRSRPGV